MVTGKLPCPKAKTVLDSLEDTGLMAINQIPISSRKAVLRSGSVNDFWHQKSVDELAEELRSIFRMSLVDVFLKFFLKGLLEEFSSFVEEEGFHGIEGLWVISKSA